MTGLHAFVREARAADIAIHSLQVSVGGQTVLCTAIPPFGVDVPHRFYSVSKSVTALAILLLAEEGRLRLDDPIIAHFPEMAPVHPWLAATRIDDMLAMTGPHSRTTYDADGGDWLTSYFRVPPTHRPGTLFTYDTSASYTLAALVERLSGTTLLEYLRPRVLDPLGIGAGARFLTGPDGHTHGGSGLIAAPGDLLPLAELINGRGARGGVQIMPARVVDRLIERRSDPATQTWGAALRHGYGRQTWLPTGGGWLMFGLGGQLVYGDPARQLAVVLTADATTLTGGDQRLVDLLMVAVSGDTTLVAAPALTAPTPPHASSSARPSRGRYRLMTGEEAPEEIDVDVDAGGGAIRIGAQTLRFDTAEPMCTALRLGDAVITAGWSAPGVLDVRVSATGSLADGADIASVRMRLVHTADGVLTVLSQGFGPAVDPSWTWRGSYRA